MVDDDFPELDTFHTLEVSESSEFFEDAPAEATPGRSDLSQCADREVCGSDAATVFVAVQVFPSIRQGTLVKWDLRDDFRDAQPHEFRLQVGRTANPAASDWEWLGPGGRDVWSLLDTTPRMYGKTAWTHYRVVLATPAGTYYSPPAPARASLPGSELAIYERLQQLQAQRLSREGTRGYLLKRRNYGELCPHADFASRECRQPNCPDCYNTGILGGYFVAQPCVYAKESGRSMGADQDENRGTIDDVYQRFEMLARAGVEAMDVWVDSVTDHRWELRPIAWLEQIRNSPTLLAVEARLLPFSEVVYSFPLD